MDVKDDWYVCGVMGGEGTGWRSYLPVCLFVCLSTTKFCLTSFCPFVCQSGWLAGWSALGASQTGIADTSSVT